MRRGFSLIELLISIAVIAVLMAVLLPALSHAKRVSSKTVCASNLRQIGLAWDGFVADPRNHGEFPRADSEPAWKYGGVQFRGPERVATLDPARPINKYLDDHKDEVPIAALAGVFRCPGDKGVFSRSRTGNGARVNKLERASVYAAFGTSYRANDALLDSTISGLDDLSHPLKQQDVYVAASRLLVIADAAWYYAMQPGTEEEAQLEASWHGPIDAGNMLAADNSVRFELFRGNTNIAINPRPERERR